MRYLIVACLLLNSFPALAQGKEDAVQMGRINNQLQAAYTAKDWEMANNLFGQSISIIHKSGDTQAEAVARTNRAALLDKMNKPAEAAREREIVTRIWKPSEADMDLINSPSSFPEHQGYKGTLSRKGSFALAPATSTATYDSNQTKREADEYARKDSAHRAWVLERNAQMIQDQKDAPRQNALRIHKARYGW